MVKLSTCSCRGDRGTELRSGAIVANRLQRFCECRLQGKQTQSTRDARSSVFSIEEKLDEREKREILRRRQDATWTKMEGGREGGCEWAVNKGKGGDWEQEQ